jgi:hypothetical protein
MRLASASRLPSPGGTGPRSGGIRRYSPHLAQEVRRELLTESKKHKAWKRLCEVPSIGPIRAAVLLGIMQTAHRFRSKRQLWTYSGGRAHDAAGQKHDPVPSTGGWEVRKIPALGKVFFLNFPLYRTWVTLFGPNGEEMPWKEIGPPIR